MPEGTLELGAGSIKNRHIADNANLDQGKLGLRSATVGCLAPTNARVWDALATLLPATGGTDDLGLYTNYTGTFASVAPYIGTGDVKTLTGNRKCAFYLTLPEDYEDAQPVSVRVHAGMITTVASTTCEIDLEVLRIDYEDGTPGSADLVTTAADDMNALGAEPFDFALTATTLKAGDLLIARLSVSFVDAATGTAVIGAIYAIQPIITCR